MAWRNSAISPARAETCCNTLSVTRASGIETEVYNGENQGITTKNTKNTKGTKRSSLFFVSFVFFVV
jgi:hypothetical protein